MNHGEVPLPQEGPRDPSHDEYTEQDAHQQRLDALARLAQSASPQQSTASRYEEQHRRAAALGQPAQGRSLAQRLVLPVVLLLAVLAFLSLPVGFPLHPWLSRLAPQPAATATPAVPLRDRQLYLDPDVPGMLVTIDGHNTTVPVIGQAAPLTLSPGLHHLTWGSAPFQSQSCMFSIPLSGLDSCDLLSSTASFAGGTAVPVIELGESLDTLPAPEQTALLQASQYALNSLPATAVQPGELYATSQGPQVATTAFQATLTFQLQSAAGAGCIMNVFGTGGACQLAAGEDCARFCSLSWPSEQGVRAASGTGGWLVLAAVALSWSYQSLDGRLIAGNQPLDWEGNAAMDNHLVMLSVTWDQVVWQVTPILGDQLGGLLRAGDGTPVGDDPGCAQAQDLLYNLRIEEPGGPPAGTVHLADSANPSAGCLIKVGSAVYLVRLGIVLPTNRAAVALGGGELPVPSLTGNEMQLVLELEGLHGQDVSTS